MLARTAIFISLAVVLIALPRSVTHSVREARRSEHPASTPAAAPAATPQPCPVIAVSSPEDTVVAGTPATFSASITTGKTYNWKVSAGTITSGQGTSSITVDTSGEMGQTIEATVEVGGLDSGCTDNTASSSVTVLAPLPFDRSTITGTVKEADGPALSGVMIKAVKNGNHFSAAATTDADGKYILRPMEVGTYRITISLRGYRTQTVQTEISEAGDLRELDFELQRNRRVHGGRRRPE